LGVGDHEKVTDLVDVEHRRFDVERLADAGEQLCETLVVDVLR